MITPINKSQGYVLMWRSIINSPIWNNPKLERIYHWIMYRANWKENTVFSGINRIALNPGQFITSYPHASAELSIPVGTIHTYLKLLQTESIVEIKSTNKYTIVTVLNWDKLQNPERKNESILKTERKQTETDNTKETSSKEETLQVNQLMARFNATYKTNLLDYGKQGRALKVIRSSYSEEEMWDCAKWLFQQKWWQEHGFDFTTIQSQIAKYKMSLQSNKQQEVYRDAKSL